MSKSLQTTLAVEKRLAGQFLLEGQTKNKENSLACQAGAHQQFTKDDYM
jgi:hypothetical protein